MHKQIYLYIFFISLVFQACERREVFEYEYEKNPQYSWGYAEFWGAHYAHYGLDNHVLSLYAFTDSLSLTDNGYLTGFGQYLHLEDIFISPSDTLFPAGDYVVSASGEAMTIAPGELFDEDGVKYDLGAYIFYFEKNDYFSVRKFIVDGKMTVGYTENTIIFDLDFVLEDESALKGRYETAQLNFSDESVTLQNSKQKIKLNPADPFVIKQSVKKHDNKRRNKYTSQ